MQGGGGRAYPLQAVSRKELLEWVEARLEPPQDALALGLADPLDTLVSTVLSQNTNDRNRDRAYAALRARFPSAEALAEASEAEIATAIQVAGLHRQKARTIREILSRIRKERGALDLGFLHRMSLDDSLSWLTASRGIGKKTAGIVLLFCFDRPYFPVDTHIRRVSTRLGLIGPSDDAHDVLNATVPSDPARLRALHLGMIQLGREICDARRPACARCPLASRCVHAGTALQGGEEGRGT